MTVPRLRAALSLLLIGGLLQGNCASAASFIPARVAVCFSPQGRCTDVIVREINSAQRRVLVQAYSFTSAPIAQALIVAHKRGVHILAVLDKSNQTGQYSAATFLINQGITTLIDDQHAIAHSKVIIIDDTTIITGSFNFTKAAEEKNAENLLIIHDTPELVKAYEENITQHASHSHPYQGTWIGKEERKKASERVGPRAREMKEPGSRSSQTQEQAVRGNKRSKVYHLPGCPGYESLSPANIVSFASEQEAIETGYRRAGKCQ